jgi:hypothetical protein
MTKSQRKTKTGSFENEQNLVPKDMGNGSTQLSKNKASPQEEAMGSTPLAKLEKLKKTARPSKRGKGSIHLAKTTSKSNSP